MFCILYLKVVPDSSSTKAIGWVKDGQQENILKINIVAPPEKGRANKLLVAFLAQSLKIKQSSIIIEKGEISKYKSVKVLCPFETILKIFPQDK